MLCIPVFRTEPRLNAELQGLPELPPPGLLGFPGIAGISGRSSSSSTMPFSETDHEPSALTVITSPSWSVWVHAPLALTLNDLAVALDNFPRTARLNGDFYRLRSSCGSRSHSHSPWVRLEIHRCYVARAYYSRRFRADSD